MTRRMTRFHIDVQHTLQLACRYVFCLVLLGIALYELHRSGGTVSLTNPWVILAGLALLLLPDLPAHVAQAAGTIGPALGSLLSSLKGGTP